MHPIIRLLIILINRIVVDRYQPNCLIVWPKRVLNIFFVDEATPLAQKKSVNWGGGGDGFIRYIEITHSQLIFTNFMSALELSIYHCFTMDPTHHHPANSPTKYSVKSFFDRFI